MTKSRSMRPGWNGLNIAAMVLGFMFFWPVGLAMLAYILWGDQIVSFFDDLRYNFHRKRADGLNSSGNLAFDDFRRSELERLEEERRRLDAMREEFDDYMRDLRRAKDQTEFDRFMKARDERRAEQDRRAQGPAQEGAPA